MRIWCFVKTSENMEAYNIYKIVCFHLYNIFDKKRMLTIDIFVHS